MSKVFIWKESNASSLFFQLQKRINTHLLLATDQSIPWTCNVRVYRQRTDLRKATAYDAIAEALETTLMDGLIEVNTSNSAEKTLYITETSDVPDTIFVSINEHTLKLSGTSISSVETIFVPKTDADFKFRQSVKISGFSIEGLKLALISLGSESSAILLEIHNSALISNAERYLLPRPSPEAHDCTCIGDLLKILCKAGII